MTMSATAAAFHQAHDKPRTPDGIIDLAETGLSLDVSERTKDSPVAPFVQKLTDLDDAAFAEVTAEDKMTDDAAKAYLWNKYPEFAQRWDSGAHHWFLGSGTAMDGYITGAELRAGGGMSPALVRDIREMIPEQRDRMLLVDRPLLYRPGSYGFFGSSFAAQHHPSYGLVPDVKKMADNPIAKAKNAPTSSFQLPPP